jgi:ribose 5-phosphate isomerase
LAFCAVPGVVESGLFIGLADAAIFANDAGETRLIEFGADGDD